MHNFFHNANATVPASEYVKTSPRILMKKVLISNKRGTHSGESPAVSMGSSVIPFHNNSSGQSGDTIELCEGRRNLNPRYFNEYFVTY
jgi:hypothetical protein